MNEQKMSLSTISNLEDNQKLFNLIRCNLSALLVTVEQEKGYYILTETQYNALSAVELSFMGAVEKYEEQVNQLLDQIKRGQLEVV